MEKKWVYRFSEVQQVEEYVNSDWQQVRALLGGKGANLAEMTRLNVPVPPGFTITTEACNAYLNSGGAFPENRIFLWKNHTCTGIAKSSYTYPLVVCMGCGLYDKDNFYLPSN